MTVGDLVRILENDVIAASGDLSFAPAGVACDHRKTVPGGLFVCVSGYVVDGHQFAAGALANGAAVLVSQKPAAELGLPPGTITAGGAPADSTPPATQSSSTKPGTAPGPATWATSSTRAARSPAPDPPPLAGRAGAYTPSPAPNRDSAASNGRRPRGRRPAPAAPASLPRRIARSVLVAHGPIFAGNRWIPCLSFLI